MDQPLNQPLLQPGQLTAAPPWILTAMQSPSAEDSKSAKSALKQTEPERNLALLEAQCPRFRANWASQQQQGLDEETWFRTVSHLNSIFGVETALFFSQASTSKHNHRSEERISKLRNNKSNLPVRCTTFGCSLDEISSCFKNNIRRNEKQEITNSPCAAHRRTRLLTEIGFIFDEKTGQMQSINENKFARYLLNSKMKMIYFSDRFYLYDQHVWKLRDVNYISRKIRNIINGFFPDRWHRELERLYMSGLSMEAQRVEQMGDRNRINLQNGMIDLNTLQLVPHDPECHSTVQVPISYDPNANCPKFMKFLHEVFEGDQQLIAIVGEMFGYCLTADVKAHKCFILYGKGANGKSVLSEILKSLCGIENVSAVSLTELEKPFARFELVDKLLNLATENEVSSSGLDTTNFKAIVSGDPIRVEEKHETGFTYQPFCKMVFGLNNLPYTKDKSYGFVRRLIIIPFNRQFSGKNANVNLIDELLEEMPGILNFALAGLKRLRSNDYIFTESDKSNECLQNYQEELNPVEMFIEDEIDSGTAADRVLNKDLRNAFDSWCQDNGHRGLLQYSQNRLNNNIMDIFKQKGTTVERIRSNGARGLQGIKLKKNRRGGLMITSENVTVDSIEDMD